MQPKPLIQEISSSVFWCLDRFDTSDDCMRGISDYMFILYRRVVAEHSGGRLHSLPQKSKKKIQGICAVVKYCITSNIHTLVVS